MLHKMVLAQISILIVIITVTACEDDYKINTQKFPDGFMFGAGSAAYQIEGAWNIDGKSENNWDRFTHVRSDKIDDGSNGDISCDSYHKYKEDVKLLTNLGVDFYRFSLSWSRILPAGFGNKTNKVGISYYNNLIDELLSHNITPLVTMFHWDLPQSLQHLGGFTNPSMADWFYDYAKICFEEFGDRVKIWNTMNEPLLICASGYGIGRFPPGLQSSGVGDYFCSYHLLKAHAKAYHLYNDTFRKTQEGKIGMINLCEWYEPGSQSKEDKEAAERQLQFTCGLYSNPIFSSEGDYPQLVKNIVAQRSKEEGFLKSRLPEFTTEEINFIKGTSDYYGLNHYTTRMTQSASTAPIGNPSFENDVRVKTWQKPDWIGLKAFKKVPWGFKKILKWVKDNYQEPEIYVTENGFADHGGIHDQGRINYHTEYLSYLLDAIYNEGINVKMYTFWSLLDLFEWGSGYTLGFGMHHANFSDPQRTRVAKDSAAFYRTVIKNRQLPTAD